MLPETSLDMRAILKRLRKSISAILKREPSHSADLSRLDMESVRSGTCFFQVDYQGCMEVNDKYSSEECCEILRGLRKTRRGPTKANLHISGDGVRLVECGTMDTIFEKSFGDLEFCTSDVKNEKGFGFISTELGNRWMCYGFSAVRVSGARISYAFGCAIDVYVENNREDDTDDDVDEGFGDDDSDEEDF